MKPNPFRRFLKPEDLMHEACVTWLQLQYPKLLFTHIPNEGGRTAFERFLYKILGVRTGMPDILIFKNYLNVKTLKVYTGLATELKIGKNKPTAIQLQRMQELRDAGWLVVVLYSLDDFIKTVNEYMSYVKN